MKQTHQTNSRHRHIIQIIVAVASLLYLLSLTGFFAYRAFDNAWRPFPAMINNFAPWLFVPLIILIPMVIWQGSRLSRIAVTGTVVLFLLLYGRNFITPVIQPPCDSQESLRLMTFNLGWHRGDPDALKDIIVEQDPDILVLEELTQATQTMFETDLAAMFPYQILNDPGLVSKYPIEEITQDKLESENRGFLRAVIDWNSNDIVVYAIHPFPPGLMWFRGTNIPWGVHDEPTLQYISKIASMAMQETLPVLLMGDFNISDQSWAYSGITDTFTDSYRQAGWGMGFTFPNGAQFGDITLPGSYTRLDYIFHSEAFCTVDAWRTCGGGSDHCAMSAELGLIKP